MSVFSNRSIDPPDERSRYAGAILDLLGNQDPLSVLRRTPSALTRSIAGLTRDQLRQPEAPAKWSLVQVLQHLADSDLVWGWRVRMILTHDRPQITGYDQDLWAERLNYADADPDEALALFNLLRRANLKLVERATPADVKRVGIHSERGEESIEYLLRLYAGHDALHLRQIDRIRAAIGLPPQRESAGDTFVQRYVKAFGSCDYAALDELYDEDVVFYTPLAWGARGREFLRNFIREFHTGYPGMTVTLHDEFYSADGTRACFRFMLHWHNTGVFFGQAPTGESGTMTETHSLRLRNGRIVEQWVGDNTFHMPYQELVEWRMDFPRDTPDPLPPILSVTAPERR